MAGAAFSRVSKALVGTVYNNTVADVVDDKLKSMTAHGMTQLSGAAMSAANAGAYQLKKALIPAGSGDEPLTQTQLKILSFRRKQPLETSRPKPPSLPPLALPSKSATPASPARGAEAPSPRISLAEQRAKTDAMHRSLIGRSTVYSALWMMHPAKRIVEDNTLLHDISRQMANGGEVTLWDEYIRVFGARLGFFEKCKARFFYWVCYDRNTFGAIASTLGDNVLRSMRARWTQGEQSKQPVLALAIRFIEGVDFKKMKSPGSEQSNELHAAWQAASAEFLNPSNGYLNGLSWFQRLLVRWYMPGIFENLLEKTLQKMKEPAYRHGFMSNLFEMAHSYYTKLDSQELVGLSVAPQLPSLSNFFSALELNLVQQGAVQSSQDVIKTSMQMSLEYLFSRPEQVELMFTELLKKANGAFEPAVHTASSPELDAELSAVKNQLGSVIETLLTSLITKKMAPTPMGADASSNLKTACKAQKYLGLENLDILYAMLARVNSSSPLEPKFNAELSSAVEFLDGLVDKLKRQHASLLQTHLGAPQSKEAFEEIFYPFYQKINGLMDVLLTLQNQAQILVNNNQLGDQFEIISKNALQIATSGEGKTQALRAIRAAQQEFSKLLRASFSEGSECDKHVSAIEANQTQAQAQVCAQDFQRWADGKKTFYFEQRNLATLAIPDALDPLMQNYQPEDLKRGRHATTASSGSSLSLVDSKSDYERPRQASATDTYASPDSLQFLKELISREPNISPSSNPLPASIAEALQPADMARFGRQIAIKAVDLIVDDRQGRFNRAAATNLLQQFSRHN
jgi:hypothetical protein